MPFAGKVRVFIWRSVNVKHTTRAVTQDGATGCSRKHAEHKHEEPACFGMTMPRAWGTFPRAAGDNVPTCHRPQPGAEKGLGPLGLCNHEAVLHRD